MVKEKRSSIISKASQAELSDTPNHFGGFYDPNEQRYVEHNIKPAAGYSELLTERSSQQLILEKEQKEELLKIHEANSNRSSYCKLDSNSNDQIVQPRYQNLNEEKQQIKKNSATIDLKDETQAFLGFDRNSLSESKKERSSVCNLKAKTNDSDRDGVNKFDNSPRKLSNFSFGGKSFSARMFFKRHLIDILMSILVLFSILALGFIAFIYFEKILKDAKIGSSAFGDSDEVRDVVTLPNKSTYCDDIHRNCQGVGFYGDENRKPTHINIKNKSICLKLSTHIALVEVQICLNAESRLKLELLPQDLNCQAHKSKIISAENSRNDTIFCSQYLVWFDSNLYLKKMMVKTITRTGTIRSLSMLIHKKFVRKSTFSDVTGHMSKNWAFNYFGLSKNIMYKNNNLLSENRLIKLESEDYSKTPYKMSMSTLTSFQKCLTNVCKNFRSDSSFWDKNECEAGGDRSRMKKDNFYLGQWVEKFKFLVNELDSRDENEEGHGIVRSDYNLLTSTVLRAPSNLKTSMKISFFYQPTLDHQICVGLMPIHLSPDKIFSDAPKQCFYNKIEKNKIEILAKAFVDQKSGSIFYEKTFELELNTEYYLAIAIIPRQNLQEVESKNSRILVIQDPTYEFFQSRSDEDENEVQTNFNSALNCNLSTSKDINQSKCDWHSTLLNPEINSPTCNFDSMKTCVMCPLPKTKLNHQAGGAEKMLQRYDDYSSQPQNIIKYTDFQENFMVNNQKVQKCENYENCRIMTEKEVEFYDEYRFNLEGEDYYYSDLEAEQSDAATMLTTNYNNDHSLRKQRTTEQTKFSIVPDAGKADSKLNQNGMNKTEQDEYFKRLTETTCNSDFYQKNSISKSDHCSRKFNENCGWNLGVLDGNSALVSFKIGEFLWSHAPVFRLSSAKFKLTTSVLENKANNNIDSLHNHNYQNYFSKTCQFSAKIFYPKNAETSKISSKTRLTISVEYLADNKFHDSSIIYSDFEGQSQKPGWISLQNLKFNLQRDQVARVNIDYRIDEITFSSKNQRNVEYDRDVLGKNWLSYVGVKDMVFSGCNLEKSL